MSMWNLIHIVLHIGGRYRIERIDVPRPHNAGAEGPNPSLPPAFSATCKRPADRTMESAGDIRRFVFAALRFLEQINPALSAGRDRPSNCRGKIIWQAGNDCVDAVLPRVTDLVEYVAHERGR